MTECATKSENIVVDGKEVMTLRSLHQRLRRVWAARGIGRRSKICLLKTYVPTVLLYGCET